MENKLFIVDIVRTRPILIEFHIDRV